MFFSRLRQASGVLLSPSDPAPTRGVSIDLLQHAGLPCRGPDPSCVPVIPVSGSRVPGGPWLPLGKTRLPLVARLIALPRRLCINNRGAGAGSHMPALLDWRRAR
jgi:hypothetical protein